MIPAARGRLSIPVNITDTGVDGAVQYKFYSGTDGTDGAVLDVTDTSILLEGLTPGSLYFVKARAVVSGSEEADVEGPWTEMLQIQLKVSTLQFEI